MAGPFTESTFRVHFDEAVWVHHVKPIDGREVVPALRRQFDLLGEAWSDAAGERSRIYADARPEESEWGRLDRLHRATAPRLTAAADRADRAVADELARAEKLRGEALAALKAGAGPDAELLPEIRSHLRGLPDAERVGMVTRAIREGDRAVIAAALGAPHYLTGLSPERHGHLLGEALTITAADAMGKVERIEKAAELVTRTARKVREWAAADFAAPPPRTGVPGARAA